MKTGSSFIPHIFSLFTTNNIFVFLVSSVVADYLEDTRVEQGISLYSSKDRVEERISLYSSKNSVEEGICLYLNKREVCF